MTMPPRDGEKSYTAAESLLAVPRGGEEVTVARDPSHKGCPRRDFIKGVAGTAAALGLGGCGSEGSFPDSTSDLPSTAEAAVGPRVRVPNPFVNDDGAPILVSVEGRDFPAMLERGLQALGGLQRLIPGGSSVLINPNLNMAEPYPGISRASSVATLVRETRAVTTGAITVADEGFDPGPQVYSYLDLYDIVQNAGGVVESFADTRGVRRSEWSADKPDFRVYSLAYDAPVIISLCNVKRHQWAGYSCAIKNNVGIVAGSGMSTTRHYLHEQASDFMAELAEIAGVVNPELFVVDAMSVLTVNGPSVTQGDPVPANRLILCGDMVATDAYCIRLLEAHDPGFRASSAQPTLLHAAQLGLGQPDLNQVDVREIAV